jgi:hypothetical protein
MVRLEGRGTGGKLMKRAGELWRSLKEVLGGSRLPRFVEDCRQRTIKFDKSFGRFF